MTTTLTINPRPKELPAQRVEGGDMLWTDIAVVDGWGAGRPPVLIVSAER